MINNKKKKIMSKQSVLIALLMVVSMGLLSCVRERSVGCPEQAMVNKINIGYHITRMPDKVAMRADLNAPIEDNAVRNVYLFIFHDNDLVRSRFFGNDRDHLDQPHFAYSVTDKVLEKYKNNGYGNFSFYLIANVETDDSSKSKEGASNVFDNITIDNLKEIRTKEDLFSLVAKSKANTDLLTNKQGAQGTVIKGITATNLMERQVKDLLMVGAIENVNIDHLDLNNLPDGLSYDSSEHTITVNIPLKKLVSKVTFNINISKKDFHGRVDDAKVVKVLFQPRQWQLYRAPRCATLFPGYKPTNEDKAGTADDNPLKDQDDYYIDSKPQYEFVNVEGTDKTPQTASFSFYCLQNYKSPLKEISGNVDDSRNPLYLREKRIKSDMTINDRKFVENGAFIYAQPNATYVRFAGNIITVYQENGVLYKDLVEATYTIHLIDPKTIIDPKTKVASLNPNNYDVEGNCNYTYNINLKGYHDLTYEVDKATTERVDGTSKKSELNPGAEGNYYSDIQSFDVDAHYSKVLVKVYASITDEENTQPFFVKTPFDYPERDPEKGGKEDVNWVHFMPIPKKYVEWTSDGRLKYNHVPLYPGDQVVKDAKTESVYLNKKLVTVDELRQYMVDMDKSGNEIMRDKYMIDKDGKRFIVFVAFIDEYYYHTDPVTNAPVTNFNTFVNASPRKMWIRTATPHQSYDRKTTEVASAIEIDQIAIQSIYSPDSKRSVGAELYDESYGTLSTEKNDDKFQNTSDGRYNENGFYTESDGKNFEYHGLLTSCIAWGLIPTTDADPKFTDFDSHWVKNKKWSEFLQEYNNDGVEPSQMDFDKSYSICDAPNTELGGWYGTIKTIYDKTYQPYDDETGQAAHMTYLNCLSRNRDNNGNGIIDPDEVQWVMPTLSTIEDMQVSRFSFQRPEYRLYGPGPYMTQLRKDINLRYPKATLSESNVIPKVGPPYMFALTGSYIPIVGCGPATDFLWVHEGLSVSTMEKMSKWGTNNPSQFNRRALTRCVRVLGDKSLQMKNPYNYNPTTRVVDFAGETGNLENTRFPPTAYRNTDINPVTGALPPHSVFSKINIPAMRFQIANKDAAISSKTYSGFRKACASHSEKSGKEDLGKWRVPNACELHYMQLAMPEVFQKTGLQYTSCTLYDTKAANALLEDIDANNKDMRIIMSFARSQTKQSLTYVSNLRCIRDLKSNEIP